MCQITTRAAVVWSKHKQRDMCHWLHDNSMKKDEWVPQVATSLNASLSKLIGDTPQFIIYDTDKCLPYEPIGSRQTLIYNYKDYAKVHVQNLHRIHNYVRLTLGLVKQRCRNLLIRNNIVYVTIHQRRNKLSKNLKATQSTGHKEQQSNDQIFR